MPAQTRDPRDLAADAATEWLAPLSLTRPGEIAAAARGVAAHFAGEPRKFDTYGVGKDTAYVDLQPGNGTRYGMVITLLPKPAAELLGYRLVIAFPEFGSCLALDAFGFHVPWYIAEKAPRLGDGGNTVVAAFTTLLSAHLDHLLNP